MRQESEHSDGGRGRLGASLVVLLAVAAAAVALLRGSDSYEVTARFDAATALVPGNLVQAGGRKVGTVKEIRLSDRGQADVELQIDEEDLAPLPEGTRASIRLASLSGQANRYIDLRLPVQQAGRSPPAIPDGGLIDAGATSSAVDVDTFFSLFDERTRKGLRDVVRGNGRIYAGSEEEANAGFEALNPSLVAGQRLFAELNRASALLERFVVSSSRLVTDLADRDESLSGLVDRLATATGAIAAEEGSLSRAVGTLPPFLRRANTTFANLRSTLDDVAPLVEETKPVAPRLRKVLAELRPFARDAVPTVRDLAALAGRPGADNDLLDLAKRVPALHDVAVETRERNGEQRAGALPTGTTSLRGQTPQLAFLRPYSVDLTGWFDDFGHSGAYDANGNFNRSAISVSAFSLVDGLLRPVPPELRQQLFDSVVAVGQNNRCPGSIERGALWKPSPDFNCDETQGPVGP
ncbi:MlaD family protein [Conexibacter sp. SYSU D00693]|uniref:MlaD family protein n=1 Tax=Conexibacter sp. SYSU D00693 TaxID=2812560 RepID=UPI00196B7E44|nr:MlaD family protein [Conexibacter sp. SYSU D00693]